MQSAMVFATLGALAVTPAHAGFNEGVTAYQRGDFPAAVKEFKAAAAKGDSDALIELALLHGMGCGVARSAKDAARYMSDAAAANNPAAKYFLAIGSVQKQGPSPESERLVRQSAEAGFPLAMAALGRIYQNAPNAEDDLMLGYAWSSLALRRHKERPHMDLLPEGEAQLVERELLELSRTFSPWDLATARQMLSRLDRRTPRSKVVVIQSCTPAAPPPTQ